MRRNISKLLLTLAVSGMVLAPWAIAQPKSDDALLTTAKRFLEISKKTLMKGVTAADVERVLEFYTDDVVYEHLRFKAKVEGKENVRKGMLSHLGDYQGTADAKLKKYIFGFNMVMLEFEQSFQVADKGALKTITRTKKTFLEFNDGKIKRIVDYE